MTDPFDKSKDSDNSHDRTQRDDTLRTLGVGSGGPIPVRIGNYSIRRLIASGGMGTVYEALQEQPRRSVALKIMKAGMFSEAGLHRFEYEAQLLARLRHPGVAQIYEAGTHREGGVEITWCGPACRSSSINVATSLPAMSKTSTLTLPGAVSSNSIVACRLNGFG